MYRTRRIMSLVFWTIAGFVFLFMSMMGFFAFLRDRGFVQQADIAPATITDKFNRPNPNGDDEPPWYISYEYTLPDNSVVTDEKEISYYEFSNIYSVGNQFEVHYDPSDPSRHMADVEQDFKNRLQSLLAIFGLCVLMFLGSAWSYYRLTR
jgi:hypothetical protein